MTESDPSFRRETGRSALFFLLTLLSVILFSTEGLVWGRPAKDSLAFAAALLGILLAHEMGHYVVARLHGYALSLPLFIPFPSGFGTLGAIIRLRSLPPSREALLEMGVAGPIAGAVVAFTILAATLDWRGSAEAPDPAALQWLLTSPPLSWLFALLGLLDTVLAKLVGPFVGAPPPGVQILVFNDPLIVRLLGWLNAGGAPGRYEVLHPATLAAWVGCMLTGINLLPIGQLDGGHVLNAVVPRLAPRLSRGLAVVVFAAGWLWAGWFVWGILLLFLGAWRPLPVPLEPRLPLRARALAVAALVLWVLTFLPVPIEVEPQPAAVLETSG